MERKRRVCGGIVNVRRRWDFYPFGFGSSSKGEGRFGRGGDGLGQFLASHTEKVAGGHAAAVGIGRR
jgi:hypothetical protein